MTYERKTVMTQADTSLISSDLPIRGRDEDKFAFVPFANDIVAHIFREGQPESLVVGLSGRWGSGKTSLLNLIDEQLTFIKVSNRQLLSIRYVPWRVEDRKSLLSDFLPLLVEKIEEEVEKSSTESSGFLDLFRPVKNYVHALKKAEPSVKALAKILSALGSPTLEKGLELINDVSLARNEEKIPDIEQLHRSAYEALRTLKIPVAVMIDDIDRLEPNEIVDLLRLVRATAQLPYITFILAYDQTHVISAVNEVLKINGQEFLEKFVQLPVAVPLVSQSSLVEIVKKRLTEQVEGLDVAQSIVEEQLETISDIIFTVEGTEAIITPRDVYRTLNTINFRINSEKEELNFEKIVYLSIIQTKFPTIFDWLNKFIEKNQDDLTEAKLDESYNLDVISKFVQPDSSIYGPVIELIKNTLSSFSTEITQ